MTDRPKVEGRRAFAPLAVITSPVVVMTGLLLITMSGLWSIHTHTASKLNELVSAVGDLNREQQRLLDVQHKLQNAVGELESGLAAQQGSLGRVDRFSRERNLIVSGIPERDDENLESMVRELFVKKLSLTYDDRDIEEVRRFGRRVPGTKEKNEGRKIVVRFANFRDKTEVLLQAKLYLNGTPYNVENDFHT